MKKTVIKIIIFVAFIGLIFLGKKLIDIKTFNYIDVVEENLTNYYVTSSDTYIDNIIAILNEKQKDETLRENIQSTAYSVIGSWYTYIDNKYLCDNDNLNACKAQKNEFNELNNKVANLYGKKCSDGYTIMRPSSYSSLQRQTDKKLKEIEDVINNPTSKNPKSSEELRLYKCERGTDCECRNGTCKCYYSSNGTQEEITCKDPNPEEKK